MIDTRRLRSWAAPNLAAALLLAVAAGPMLGQGVRAQGKPSLEVVSPKPGATVTSDDIPVQLKVSDFKIDCLQAGRPDAAGVGHIHLMLDGMSMAQLANFYCADRFTVPGAGLAPGTHKLVVDLASNTHMDMMDTAQEVDINYQPANPKPLPAAADRGRPSLELVSPKDGATVPPKFTIEVKPVNFEPSAALEGEQNIPGYGHIHVFVDTPMGNMGGMMAMGTPASGMMGSPMTGGETAMGTPGAEGAMGNKAMMSLAGMILMPGAGKFQVDLTDWGPGKHTIFIEPVQNDHTTFEDAGRVEFTVTVDPNASAASS